MKKLTQKRKAFLLKKSFWKMYLLTKTNHLKGYKSKPKKYKTSEKPVIIKSPQKFKFLDNKTRKELDSFIEKITQHLKSGRKVKIDFSETTELFPCGTIIFIANIDVLKNQYPNMITCTYPKNEVVEQLFQHVGLLSWFGLSSRRKIDHDQVKYWHFHSGIDVNPETFKDLTQYVKEIINHKDKELFADCLNEAVTNTHNHAYKATKNFIQDRSLQKWWMFSLLKEDRLGVVIYDLGMGIPGSIRSKPEFFDLFRRRKYSDKALIKQTVNSNLTITKLRHRGKGFPEMLEFAKNIPDGFFSVWSGKAGFKHRSKPDATQDTKVIDIAKLRGTLILWMLPLTDTHNENA